MLCTCIRVFYVHDMSVDALDAFILVKIFGLDLVTIDLLGH